MCHMLKNDFFFPTSPNLPHRQISIFHHDRRLLFEKKNYRTKIIGIKSYRRGRYSLRCFSYTDVEISTTQAATPRIVVNHNNTHYTWKELNTTGIVRVGFTRGLRFFRRYIIMYSWYKTHSVYRRGYRTVKRYNYVVDGNDTR